MQVVEACRLSVVGDHSIAGQEALSVPLRVSVTTYTDFGEGIPIVAFSPARD